MAWKPNFEEAAISLCIENSSGEKIHIDSGEIKPGRYTVYGRTEVLRAIPLPEDAYIAVLFIFALTDSEGKNVGEPVSVDAGIIIQDEQKFPITSFTVPDMEGLLQWSAHAHAGTPESNNTSFGDWGVRTSRIVRQ